MLKRGWKKVGYGRGVAKFRDAAPRVPEHQYNIAQIRNNNGRHLRSAGEQLADRRADDVERNRRRLLRNGFAMLRWYQRLGHDRQDERVWISVKAPPGYARGLQR